MHLDIGGEQFDFVAVLQPERGPDGVVIPDMPQSRYHNLHGLRLNKHGAGPFCRFRAASHLPYEGVYAITVDRRVVYIGECVNLSQRFGPSGYGAVQPRNCYEGGQSTNCKVNHLILMQAQRGSTIELWFLRTPDRKSLETLLIRQLRPEWNGQMGVGQPLTRSSAGTVKSCEARPGDVPVCHGTSDAVTNGRSEGTIFVTYANKANPHVTIHRDGCGHINKHGGVDHHGNGWYKRHSTYEEARAYARTTGLPLSDCRSCRPCGQLP